MQLFSANAKMFFKKFNIFFAPQNMKKKHPQKLLIIGPDPFFSAANPAQISIPVP